MDVGRTEVRERKNLPDRGCYVGFCWRRSEFIVFMSV